MEGKWGIVRGWKVKEGLEKEEIGNGMKKVVVKVLGWVVLVI